MTPCSQPIEGDPVADAAQRLAPGPVRHVAPGGGGGNNRIYRVELTDGRSFALKWYPPRVGDPRDRLGTEWAALSLMAPHLPGMVPATIAREGDFALYQWMAGDKLERTDESDIGAALDFLARLQELRDRAPAIGLASEACLSVAEILSQIDRRAARLSAVEDPVLQEFLTARFTPMRQRLSRAAPEGDLPPDRRCLSPSDFGFHNMLRRADGRLCFVDFEYFGWDDPAKLTADFLLHPGMALSPSQIAAFRIGAEKLFGADPDFTERLRRVLPLYGLRWTLILLNEFLPERWQARAFAGQLQDRDAILEIQLGKAERRLASLADFCEDLSA